MVYEHKKIENLSDYFVELSKRREKGVYFYRINAVSEPVKDFLYNYYDAARKMGVIIEGRIGNPTEANLSYYNEIMGSDFDLSIDFICKSLTKWLPRMQDGQRQSVAEAIHNSLDDMKKQGKNDNMLKNAYVKYMCWLYYKFERIVNSLGNENVPKILYEGTINSYELLLISIISSVGCDVVLLQKDGDKEYLKLDPASSKSIAYEAGNLSDFQSDFSVKKMYADRLNAANRTATPAATQAGANTSPVATQTGANTSHTATPQAVTKTAPAAPQQAGNTQTNAGPKLHINVSRTTAKTSGEPDGAQSGSSPSAASAGNTAQPRFNINTSNPFAGRNGKGTAGNGQNQAGVGSAMNAAAGQGVYRSTNAWIEGKGLSDIQQATSLRGNDNNLFYNVFCRINGAEDRLTYENELYQFYMSLKKAKRCVVVVNQKIPTAENDEIMGIKRANYVRVEQLLAGLSANIQYPANPELREIMLKAFESIIREEAGASDGNINKLTNKAVYLLCWLRRYQSKLFSNWKKPDIGCFIYMGGCKDANEAMFLKFLSRLPVDVLILCPNLNQRCCLEDQTLYEINNPVSLNITRFPEGSVGGAPRIGTAAYHAERDLDSIMYNDNVVFRDQQFTKANVIMLQTMDREIKILWKNELKYRPNFGTADGVVNMPVIFSKMSGVKDKKVDEYWISVKQLMTPETIVVDRPPYITQTTPNPVKAYAPEFFKNGKLQRNRIKNHQAYQYGFLREEMQEHLLDKLEALIGQRLIKGTFENGTEYTIISVALNLSKDVTRLIQKFDFTKSNPKLLYINASENLISLEDSIYALYLNMIGFDVVFYIPTGYNTESHFNRRLMEEHQLGEYMYDLQIPDWGTVPLTAQKSWVDKIFKKG